MNLMREGCKSNVGYYLKMMLFLFLGAGVVLPDLIALGYFWWTQEVLALNYYLRLAMNTVLSGVLVICFYQSTMTMKVNLFSRKKKGYYLQVIGQILCMVIACAAMLGLEELSGGYLFAGAENYYYFVSGSADLTSMPSSQEVFISLMAHTLRVSMVVLTEYIFVFAGLLLTRHFFGTGIIESERQTKLL